MNGEISLPERGTFHAVGREIRNLQDQAPALATLAPTGLLALMIR